MSSPLRVLIALTALCLLARASLASRYRGPPCRGTARYRVTFHMRWVRSIFGRTVPDNAMLSPLTAAAHKNRFSAFTEFGYASSPVEMVAEAGANAELVRTLRGNPMVGNVAALSAPTSNVGPASVNVTVDASKGYTHLSAIAMLAPTPDWVTFFNNVNVCRHGKFRTRIIGRLYGYDAGTEETIGVDQQPRQNIYRLQGPRYPQYGRYPVGWYSIRRME